MLLKKIKDKKANVAVLGLGQVGLPLACQFAKKGFKVIGIDVDGSKINKLKRGNSYISDISDSVIKGIIGKKLIVGTPDLLKRGWLDVVIICVPTPLRKSKEPNISYVVDAAKVVSEILSKEMLVIVESTVFPGATEEVVLPILEGSGLIVGKDFYLGFSPERIDPGNKKYNIQNTPKVISGITKNCLRMVEALYSEVIDNIVPVSSTRVAEMAKLLENTFRAVNIGLVNEVAIMCDKLKIDTWEVIKACSTKPFGYMPFYPGPGLGGHCIPIDPHYLSWKMRSFGYDARFIQLADEINSQMPNFVVNKIMEKLNEQNKTLKGSKIFVIGVAYKKDVGDIRESPALDVIKLLVDKGASVSYHDPFISSFNIGSKRFRRKKLDYDKLKEYDCLLILTEHSNYDYKKLVSASRVVFDTKNATSGIRDKRIFKL